MTCDGYSVVWWHLRVLGRRSLKGHMSSDMMDVNVVLLVANPLVRANATDSRQRNSPVSAPHLLCSPNINLRNGRPPVRFPCTRRLHYDAYSRRS